MNSILTKMKIAKLRINYETLLYSLLFLFPIFAISVRHWSSITFSFLVLLGIVYYFSSRKKQSIELHKYEKFYLWFLATHFVTFLLSMALNYPERFGDTQFGNEIRFVLVIPLYFLIIKHKHSLRWLIYGAIISIPASFSFCLHELYVEGRRFFEGAYSQLFSGPVILIYLILVVSYYIPRLNKNDKLSWILLVGLIGIATFSIITTTVRAAYIGYMLLAPLLLFMYTKGRFRVVALISLLIAMMVISVNSQSVKSRMSVAINGLINYIETDNLADPNSRAAASSVGTRLEMWRASPLFVKDHPLLGVGNGNYQVTMKGYVEQGLIHPSAALHSHPHNVFVNAAMNRGLLGLLLTCLVFFWPLYVYIFTYRQNINSARLGILFVTIIFVISMSEAAPFNKSNFIATYLILSLVIFQYHMNEVKKLVKLERY